MSKHAPDASAARLVLIVFGLIACLAAVLTAQLTRHGVPVLGPEVIVSIDEGLSDRTVHLDRVPSDPSGAVEGVQYVHAAPSVVSLRPESPGDYRVVVIGRDRSGEWWVCRTEVFSYHGLGLRIRCMRPNVDEKAVFDVNWLLEGRGRDHIDIPDHYSGSAWFGVNVTLSDRADDTRSCSMDIERPSARFVVRGVPSDAVEVFAAGALWSRHVGRGPADLPMHYEATGRVLANSGNNSRVQMPTQAEPIGAIEIELQSLGSVLLTMRAPDERADVYWEGVNMMAWSDQGPGERGILVPFEIVTESRSSATARTRLPQGSWRVIVVDSPPLTAWEGAGTGPGEDECSLTDSWVGEFSVECRLGEELQYDVELERSVCAVLYTEGLPESIARAWLERSASLHLEGMPPALLYEHWSTAILDGGRGVVAPALLPGRRYVLEGTDRILVTQSDPGMQIEDL